MFGKHAPEFVAAGVPVFPVRLDGKAKRPMVKRPQMFGKDAALKLASNPKYADAGIGVWCGPKSGLVAVDIDSPDASLIDEVMNRCGESPLIAQTPSKGHHVYYRDAGERRQIKPKDGPFAGLPVDICGDGGFIVAPPSLAPQRGAYSFIEGGLSELPNLPQMNSYLPENEDAWHIETREECETPSLRPDAVFEGQRDVFIFREARILASVVNSLEVLYEQLAEINQARCAPPLTDVTIVAKARHVWNMKERGKLLIPGDRAAVLHLDAIIDLSANPSALALASYLLAHHAPNHKFVIVPEAIAKSGLTMSSRTIWTAREYLVDRGYLVSVRRTRGGATNLYRFGPSTLQYLHGIEHTSPPAGCVSGEGGSSRVPPLRLGQLLGGD